MASGIALVKALAVVGLLIVLTSAITGNTPPEWTAVRSSIQAGIVWPTFVDPFAEDLVVFTFAPGETVGDDDETVGCPGGDSWLCLENDDGDESYVRVNATSGELLFMIANLPLNETRHITNVVLHVTCRTEDGEADATWRTGAYVPSGNALECGSFYREYSFSMSKVPDDPFPAWTWTDLDAIDNAFGVEVFTDEAIFVTRAYVNVWTSGELECDAPPGAWFPWLDETACAIGNGARLVFNALTWLANGFMWLGATVVSIILFVGGVVVNLILGTLSVYGTLFNLGAPSPVQEFIDVIVIVSAAYIIFVVVSLIRGTEG